MSYVIRFLVAAVLTLICSTSQAHMKWFGEYNLTSDPVPLSDILNTPFLLLFALAIGAVFVASVIDRAWGVESSQVFLKRFFIPHRDYATLLVRISTGVFFFGLWLQGETILTPEIVRSGEPFIDAVQLTIAAATLSSRLCYVAGVGILVLYGYGMYLHGPFHLLDYLFFLGFANYLIWVSVPARDRSTPLSILYITLAFSLMWGAMEKFSYPNWYYPLLDEKPYLTFGFDQDTFVRLAGFVELTLAFLLLFSRNILLLVAIGLNGIFIAATADFGKVDAVGHLLIMTTLVVMSLEGPSKHTLARVSGTRLAQSCQLAGLFAVGSLSLLALYHALRYGLCT